MSGDSTSQNKTTSDTSLDEFLLLSVLGDLPEGDDYNNNNNNNNTEVAPVALVSPQSDRRINGVSMDGASAVPNASQGGRGPCVKAEDFGPNDFVFGIKTKIPRNNNFFEDTLQRFLKQKVEQYCDCNAGVLESLMQIKLKIKANMEDPRCIATYSDVHEALGIKAQQNDQKKFYAEYKYYTAKSGSVNKKNYADILYEEINEFSKLNEKLGSLRESRIDTAKKAVLEKHGIREEQDTKPAAKVRVVQPSISNVDYERELKTIRSDMHESLNEIAGYQTVEQFKLAVRAGRIHRAMDRLIETQAQLTQGITDDEEKRLKVVEWAKQLMLDLRGPKDSSNEKHLEASLLDADRKICLELLYTLVRSMRDNIVAENALDEFKFRNVERILHVCLPMDRAKCLLQ